MLRSQHDNEIWCVTQPDHAAVSGYLASHWGNAEFRRPGGFAETSEPEQLRAETVLGIAQHDNGWWEWEASPELSTEDGFPLDLRDVIRNQQDGMNRWRRGIPRLAEHHPYASLLISYHASLLYAPGAGQPLEPSQFHFLSGDQYPALLEGDALNESRQFLAEIEGMQSELRERIAVSAATESWIGPDHLLPHVRLLQLLDAASLSMCSDVIPDRDGRTYAPGQGRFLFAEIPGSGWDDRVTIQIKGRSAGRIVWDPYPFDINPLPVTIPGKRFSVHQETSQPFPTWWNATPPSAQSFQLVSH